MVGAGSQTRSHCTRCIARLPGSPLIKVYDRHAPVICRRHRRWLGIPTTPGQFDLSNTPEIITANRRRDRLFRSREDQQWTDTQFRAAEWVTTGWSGIVHPLSHRHLTERWKQRSASIATATGREPPARLAMLPETVVLAEIFCDPEWRRQIATASPRPEKVLPARRPPSRRPFRVRHPRARLRRPAQELGRSTPGPAPRHLHRRLAPTKSSLGDSSMSSPRRNGSTGAPDSNPESAT